MSADAKACPKCGARRKGPVGWIGISAIALFGLLAYKMLSSAGESMDQSRAATVVQEATATASWAYRDTDDAASGKKGKSASIGATKQLSLKFPYEGANQPMLTLRKVGSNTDVLVSIDKGQIICPPMSCQVDIRFDDGKAESYTGTMPTDHSSTTIFLGPEKKLAEKIKRSKKAIVVLTIFEAGNNPLEFKTANLTW